MIPQSVYVFLLLLFFPFLKLQARTVKVLFIGNSITYFNDMPQTVRSIALQWQDTLNVTMYAPGGTGFANHVSDPNVYSHFRTGNWDYVVLQPGTGDSGGPAVGGTPVATTVSRGRIMRDSIYRYSPCVKVLLYEIAQARSSAPFSSLEAVQNVILANVTSIADSLGFGIVPAGEVIRNAYRNDTTVLYSGLNDIHPNPVGSYGIACAFASVICHKSVKDLIPNSGLDPLLCKRLQRNADSICADAARWRLGVYTPRAHFSFNQVAGSMSVQFKNTATGMDSVKWNFGDGTSGNGNTPLKPYANAGSYKVRISTFKGGCVDNYDTTVLVKAAAPTGVNSFSVGYNVTIYPNPASNKLFVVLPPGIQDALCRIVDLKGAVLIEEKLLQTKNELSLEALPPGIYFIAITGMRGEWHHQSKIIVE